MVERNNNWDGVTFFHTNESLDAIIAGLIPQSNDNILAICGSGDQAFALVQYGAKVFAVDNIPEQVTYAESRKTALLKEDITGFLPASYLPENRIRGAQRILIPQIQKVLVPKKIIPHLDGLQFKTGNLFNELLDNTLEFNKMYLSNSMEYIHHADGGRVIPRRISFSSEEEQIRLKLILQRLTLGGLVYFSGPEETYTIYHARGYPDKVEKELNPELISDLESKLVLVPELTKKARDYEKKWSTATMWAPAVYRKQPK
ncbi:MAG: hypothetical protein WC471_04050 [Candidatus Woesearchaeota archaeon]